MDEQAGAEFRLEPGCLWRHYVAGVGNVDKLLHRNRVEGESHLHLPAVHPAAEFAESADPTDKVDSLVCPEILDAQNPVQNQIGEDGHIEHSDWIGVVVASLTGLEGVPLAVEIHREIVQVVRLAYSGTAFFDLEVV